MKMRNIFTKKGISPVIATVLLIVVAIGLFIAIFFWIRGMQQEAILKFNSDIKQSCLNVNFDATYQGGTIQIQNTGSIPIWKADVYLRQGGSLTNKGFIAGPIMPGTSASQTGIACGGSLEITPILLGNSQKTGAEAEYKCQEKTKTISC
jgi:flagellin-like protein